METFFVTKKTDEFGVKALEIFSNLGAKVQTLESGQTAPWGSIALFKAQRGRPSGAGRYMKTAALRLENELVPSWAKSTPFRVEIYSVTDLRPIPRSRTDTPSTFRRALENLWQMYHKWNPGDTVDPIPWTRAKKDPSIVGSLYEQLAANWHARITKTEAWFTLIKSSQEKTSTERLTDRKISAGSWYVNVCNRVVRFPGWAQRAGRDYLASWQKHFANEETWAKKEMGVPSLIVRLDCVLIDGSLRIYEVEERPAGIGITNKMNPKFADGLADIRRFWPDFKVVVSPNRTGGDDHLWAEVAEHGGFDTEIVLVRAEPEEKDYHKYAPRSISSVVSKGNKSYGVPLGFWKSVSDSQSQLPWDEAFVLKLSPKLDLAASAPLLCAGITTYSPMRHWGVTKGKKVGVREMNPD